MKILALDTSTRNAAVALRCDDAGLFVAPMDPDTRHGRGLIPSIAHLFQQAGLRPKELEAVAVGLGPGSYTGLRVGLSAAKTLAYTTGCRLIGLDSLEVVARNAPPEALRIAVIADAQRGELYTADFERVGRGTTLMPKRPAGLERIETWIARMAEQTDILVIGPGKTRLEAVDASFLSRLSFGQTCMDHPTGEGLMALAHDVCKTDRRDDPWYLEPIYLRRSAAEDQWDAQASARKPPT